MEHAVAHDVGRALAKKATIAAMATYGEKYKQYSPRVEWKGDYKASVMFTAKGFTLDGTLEVRDHDILVGLEVPLLLRPFKSRAIAILEREIQAWLTRARSGEVK